MSNMTDRDFENFLREQIIGAQRHARRQEDCKILLPFLIFANAVLWLVWPGVF